MLRSVIERSARRTVKFFTILRHACSHINNSTNNITTSHLQGKPRTPPPSEEMTTTQRLAESETHNVAEDGGMGVKRELEQIWKEVESS